MQPSSHHMERPEPCNQLATLSNRHYHSAFRRAQSLETFLRHACCGGYRYTTRRPPHVGMQVKSKSKSKTKPDVKSCWVATRYVSSSPGNTRETDSSILDRRRRFPIGTITLHVTVPQDAFGESKAWKLSCATPVVVVAGIRPGASHMLACK